MNTVCNAQLVHYEPSHRIYFTTIIESQIVIFIINCCKMNNIRIFLYGDSFYSM